jgi:RNA polymerase sigma-70 factor (ECF subfamily)
MSQIDKRGWVLAALDEYEVRLLRYALRLLGDHDLARDAVQHAFVKLCDQSPETVGERPAAWLYRVCRNRALDHLRQRGRQPSLETAAGKEEAPSADRLSGHDPDPALVAQSQELVLELRRLMSALPDAQREAIDLWCDGLAYRQIAEIVERQEGYVRVLVHRGLTALREHPRVRAWLSDEPSGPRERSTTIAPSVLLR